MNETALYAEAKDDLQSLSGPLFDFARKQVRKRGAFLPFAAVLDGDGKLALHAIAPQQDATNSVEVLPQLLEVLQSRITETTRGVALCEWVTVTPSDRPKTDAVKVLAEHANGLTLALYLPMRKGLLRRWTSGEVFAVPAKPEVGLVRAR